MSDQSKSLGLSIADVNRAIRSPAGALTALRKTMSDRVAVACQAESKAPVIDWSTAPKGFPIWIQEEKPGYSGSGWHAEEKRRYIDERGGYWPKSCVATGKITVHVRPELPEEVWSYTDDFKIQFPSLKALLADYSDVDHPPSVGGSDTVYRGEWVTPDPAKYVIGVEGVTEHMYCQAADEIEDLDDYPQVSEEGAAELEALLKAWARKHAQPDFRIVANITPHVLSDVF